MNDGIDTMRDNNDIAPVQEHPERDVQQGYFQEGTFLLSAESAERPVYRLPGPLRLPERPGGQKPPAVDEETPPIVRRLFAWALEGHGPNYIRRRLEEEKIPCPTWWNRERGFRNVSTKWEKKDPENGRYMWDFSVIKDILMNPVYTGLSLPRRRNTASKSAPSGRRSHRTGLWWRTSTNRLLTARALPLCRQAEIPPAPPPDRGNQPVCGAYQVRRVRKVLTIRTTNDKHPKQIYSCKTYNAYGKHHCTQHRVEYDTLYTLC